ncbi:MAG TPA: electron transfer flavoprotein subunit beta/FixA family protein [Rhodocyclaceae bacterium]|nr:electron transfer flavoprotein subunit beta/FixA family protein [Rhodocyclaceae bacterium]
MKLVACVKATPDTTAAVKVLNGKPTWGEAPVVINPWDEFAVEAALRLKEADGGTVTAVSVGGEEAKIALRHALAMGVDEAVLVSDPALASADPQAIARILAATLQKIGGVDLAFFGRQAIDDDSGTTPAQTARLLGWPALTLASVVKFEGGSLRVERAIEEGRQIVTAKPPAVVSLVKDYGEPRFPSFMGIRKASKAEIPVWNLAQVGVAAPAAVVQQLKLQDAPVRQVVCEFITGGNPQEIAEHLVDKVLGEKLL